MHHGRCITAMHIARPRPRLLPARLRRLTYIPSALNLDTLFISQAWLVKIVEGDIPSVSAGISDDQQACSQVTKLRGTSGLGGMAKSKLAATVDTFIHFTYLYSQKMMVLCDVQTMNQRIDSWVMNVIFNPMVHSPAGMDISSAKKCTNTLSPGAVHTECPRARGRSPPCLTKSIRRRGSAGVSGPCASDSSESTALFTADSQPITIFSASMPTRSRPRVLFSTGSMRTPTCSSASVRPVLERAQHGAVRGRDMHRQLAPAGIPPLMCVQIGGGAARSKEEAGCRRRRRRRAGSRRGGEREADKAGAAVTASATAQAVGGRQTERSKQLR
ncbi:hypothetical protein GGX14DRAFT_384568 [Mycena pura]|uniref:Alpha-type protein kinase domain-containing protein n=1 Tax=Mycena pura TaxID=153505 RepID=A0AAD6YVN8_9AGAR|nr:hypothetical protein GGX14DRAFT_384568 [Mycena pura]